jgi:hypothetical protein
MSEKNKQILNLPGKSNQLKALAFFYGKKTNRIEAKKCLFVLLLLDSFDGFDNNAVFFLAYLSGFDLLQL